MLFAVHHFVNSQMSSSVVLNKYMHAYLLYILQDRSNNVHDFLDNMLPIVC